MQITVKGKASGKSTTITYEPKDLDRNLMYFLKSHGFTIASSCNGEGVCLKCIIQNEWPTCQLSLKQFLERQPNGDIWINYL